MKRYKFVFNGKSILIEGYSVEDAQNKFEEKMGFWPSEGLVEMSLSKKPGGRS